MGAAMPHPPIVTPLTVSKAKLATVISSAENHVLGNSLTATILLLPHSIFTLGTKTSLTTSTTDLPYRILLLRLLRKFYFGCTENYLEIF